MAEHLNNQLITKLRNVLEDGSLAIPGIETLQNQLLVTMDNVQ